jgi:two-component system alkaline phosphatase synthesis response regulator PhoP
MASKILIIDDDRKLTRLIKEYLYKEGFLARIANDGEIGLAEISRFKPDVIILDVMMPGMDGIDLLSKLRPRSDAYVIMLTAKSEETDKIIGLRVGADDYMTKPFSPRELVARIRAAIRRLKIDEENKKPESLVFKDITINSDSRTVAIENTLISLTKTEFDLLEILARNNGIAFSREKLLEKVWGFDYTGDSRMVDVHIGNLRKKIGFDVIKTIRGIGYKFDYR